MLAVVESGKWCGQYFLGFLWASSENELAAAATMLQAVGLWGRGEESIPSVHFHCTHIWASRNWEERARERWTEPADTHFLAASDSSLTALGHTETRGPRLSDRWRDHAQAVWCPPEQNAVPPFSWLFDSLLSLILGGGGKEDAIYNSTKAIYFEPWRCWLHIYSFKIIFDTFSA